MEQDLTSLCKARCYKLLEELDVLNNFDRPVTGPLCRYILGIPHAIPIKHIIIGERPYASNIFPFAASAMSFDPVLEPNTTPSVHYIARDIAKFHDIEYEVVHDWFRDSWKYLACGILVVNTCVYKNFMDPMSDRERIAMEKFLKDIIMLSAIISSQPVHVCSMGNPAKHSADRMRSSIPEAKKYVRMHSCPNPAWPSHKRGDQKSPEITLEKKSIVKYLFDIVKSTLQLGKTFTATDFYNMAGQDDDVMGNMVKASTKAAERFAEIEAMFKGSGNGKPIDNGEMLFKRAKESMLDLASASIAARTKLSFMKIEEPANVGKQSYYNQRLPYNRQGSMAGTSSRAPSNLSSGTPKSVNVGFADDDTDDDAPSAVTPSSTVAGSSAMSLEKSPAPETPVRRPSKPPTSVMSARSYSSTPVGFISEDSGEETDTRPVSPIKQEKSTNSGNVSKSKASEYTNDSSITADEANDMTYVSEYVELDEEFGFERIVVESLREALKSSRAQSPIAMDILSAIREIRADPKAMQVDKALGYGDLPATFMASPVVQVLMKYVK